jgi:hypothetical protein
LYSKGVLKNQGGQDNSLEPIKTSRKGREEHSTEGNIIKLVMNLLFISDSTRRCVAHLVPSAKWSQLRHRHRHRQRPSSEFGALLSARNFASDSWQRVRLKGRCQVEGESTEEQHDINHCYHHVSGKIEGSRRLENMISLLNL